MACEMDVQGWRSEVSNLGELKKNTKEIQLPRMISRQLLM